MALDPTSSAFPAFSSYGQVRVAAGGLTKREYFAALAMQGFQSANYEVYPNKVVNTIAIAELAVHQADALIAALNAEGHGDGA